MGKKLYVGNLVHPDAAYISQALLEKQAMVRMF